MMGQSSAAFLSLVALLALVERGLGFAPGLSSRHVLGQHLGSATATSPRSSGAAHWRTGTGSTARLAARMPPTMMATKSSRLPKTSSPQACPRDAPAVVVFTGHGDLRVHDNAALEAASSGRSIEAVFAFDPEVLAFSSDRKIKLIYSSVKDLSESLAELGVPLTTVIGRFDAAENIQETLASSPHIYIHEDASTPSLAAVDSIKRLAGDKGSVHVWRTSIRNDPITRTNDFLVYEKKTLTSGTSNAPRALSLSEGALKAVSNGRIEPLPLPPLSEVLDSADAARPSEVRDALLALNGDSAFGSRETGGEKVALDMWEAHRKLGSVKFAEEYLQADTSRGQLEQIAMAAAGPDGLAYGEAFVRGFSELLSLGCISPALIRRDANEDAWSAGPFGAAAKSSQKAVESIEAREWHTLLADLDHDTDSEREDSDVFRYKYWRWQGHLVRYAEGGLTSKDAPAILLVHGFGASADQWHKCIKELGPSHRVYAIDLLGFGHSEKPYVTYSQYMWESVVRDFSLEVVRTPLFLAGNSIGGYTALSAAAHLKSYCLGLVLCNSAGRIVDREVHESEIRSRGGTTKTILRERGAPPPKKTPQWALDFAGKGIIAALRPNVEGFCVKVFPDRPEEVQPRLVENIVRDSKDPGGYSILAAGFKLPPQASKNELLEEFGGKLLVTQGMNDPLGGGISKERFATYARAHPEADLTMVPIQAGHCPHDEAPVEVSAAMAKFMAENSNREAAVPQLR